MANIKGILKKVESGEQLTDKDLEAIGKFRVDLENGNTPDGFSSSNAFKDAYAQLISALGNSDAYKQRIAQKAQEAKGDKVAEGLQLLIAGSDILTSINQIRQSNRGLESTVRPGLPSAPRRDPLLSQRLRQAQRQIFNQSAGLAPTQLAINDQFRADLSNARTASTGQASTFGSLAQVAANRRNRANLNLAPIAQEQANIARGQFDQLLGLRGSEIQDDFTNRLALAQLQQDQYNADLEAYGRLGAAGRSNLRTSLSNIAPRIGRMIGSIPVRTGFGSDIDNYANDIEGSLFGRFQSPFMNNNYRIA